MKKIICDVCGTDYPETASQCPVCGCVCRDSNQTSAGNSTANGEETAGYTYVKGGRFSKSNVCKRLKAAPVPPQPTQQEMEDDEEYDEDEDASNRGLIAVVVLLLIAIIAVSSYIAITFFGGIGDPNGTGPQSTLSTNGPSQDTTRPTGGTGPNDRIPCTGLQVETGDITLVSANSVWPLEYKVIPSDATDIIAFASSNPAVATVDASGRVTAVGAGEATITVTCGSFKQTIKVKCKFGGTPVTPPNPGPGQTVELKLRYEDVTLDKVFYQLQLYHGTLNPAAITWTSSNESVAVVKDGLVTPVSKGNALITAEYQGQKATCWIRVTQEALDKMYPTTPDVPDQPTDSTAELKLRYEDVTLDKVFYQLQLYKGTLNPADITWTSSNESVAVVKDGLVTPVSKGNALITAEYQGQKVTCWIRVSQEAVDAFAASTPNI